MQLRHLRYFVGIVNAGSFSRAASVIHVAQPALSQQMAELEEKLGVTLLHRHARGVRATPAGDVLYREAVAILRQIEHLPALVRSSDGEPEGSVDLGMSSTLAAILGGAFISACRTALPKVLVRFHVSDSDTLKAAITSQDLDLALVFEDNFVAGYSRHPLFTQRLCYITTPHASDRAATISLSALAQKPLVLPGAGNVLRRLLERHFNALNLRPNITTEGDQYSSIMTLVRQGLGGSVIPRGQWERDHDPDFARPQLIEPPLHLTASVVTSSELAPSRATEAVRCALIDFASTFAVENAMPGLDPVTARDL